MKPKVDPYVVPRSRTPNVCPVTGTGEPGTGTAICAKAAKPRMPLTTKTAFVTVITFSFGLVWLHQYTGQSWSWTISAGLTPFIIGEALKIAIAGTSLPALWRLVNRKNK